MKNAAHIKGTVSRILALAMTLMLLLGLFCPAASAEGLLSRHREEIADVIDAARSDLKSLGDDLAAAREEVRERVAASDLLPDGWENNLTITVDTSRFNNNTIILGYRSASSGSSSVPTGGLLTTTAPKTGDLNNLVLWIVIVAVSALALAAALFFLLRKNKKRKK